MNTLTMLEITCRILFTENTGSSGSTFRGRCGIRARKMSSKDRSNTWRARGTSHSVFDPVEKDPAADKFDTRLAGPGYRYSQKTKP